MLGENDRSSGDVRDKFWNLVKKDPTLAVRDAASASLLREGRAILSRYDIAGSAVADLLAKFVLGKIDEADLDLAAFERASV